MANTEEMDRAKLVELMVTQSEPEANIVRGILEESGIHCVLITPVPHNIYPFTVNGLAAIRIKVLDSQLEAAKELLRDHENNPVESAEEDPEDTN